MSVYEPSDDSFLFSSFLEGFFSDNFSIGSVLDMGTGSGILAHTAASFVGFDRVLAVDCNPDAVLRARSLGLRAVESDLFSNISETFDLVLFNAPYLPLDEREPVDSRLATTGGVRGDEVALRFLRSVKKHLNPGGKVFLLVSSLTPMDVISRYSPVVLFRKKIFEEELLVLSFDEASL